MTKETKMHLIPITDRRYIMAVGLMPCKGDWCVGTVLRILGETERLYRKVGDASEALRVVRARECLEGYVT